MKFIFLSRNILNPLYFIINNLLSKLLYFDKFLINFFLTLTILKVGVVHSQMITYYLIKDI